MNQLQIILLIVLGCFFTIGGVYILLGTKKTKDIMDVRERRGNILGSIFLLLIGFVLLSWGGFIWYSLKTTPPQELQNTTQKDLISSNSKTHEEPEKQQKPPLNPEQQKAKKQEAEEAVKAFNQIQKDFNKIIEEYNQELINIDKGTTELTGTYNADKLSQQSIDLYEDIQNLEVASQYIHYQELMLDSVLYLQGSIESLRACIVDQKFTLFNEAQEYLAKAIEKNKLANIGIKSQAALDGYTP